ncbi:hypothetical protein BH11PSE11_BH11PSE11_29800 [soil metagenome]
MTEIIKWLEQIFSAIPLSLLEGWGRFGYYIGCVLMLAAFGGFTFRAGDRWAFGRERQTWDSKAFLSMVLTFVLIFASGYIGSFIVLVPGAQTFESLKDLSVFLCIVLFGYPALIAVPFAYGLSDLMEGVPPEFLLDWGLGYFINPACFWVAYQLIGKRPDFRRARTWGWYLLFVLIFMAIEPQLWGFICSGKFTSEISYRTITPALFFTTSVTWALAPVAMLLAFPLARKYGLFWAEMPRHVRERLIGSKQWIWESGPQGQSGTRPDVIGQGMPIRVFLAAPFIALVLGMVGAVAYLTLRSGEEAANALAVRLHQEISVNIDLQLDDYLEKARDLNHAERVREINGLLARSSIARQGRAFLIDRNGMLIASSAAAVTDGGPAQVASAFSSADKVVQIASRRLQESAGLLQSIKSAMQFRFDVVTAKPLSRETWLAQATPYQDRSGRIDWIEVTAMPESAYLAGVRAGNSQSAKVLAIALTLSLLMASLLAAIMAVPIRRISRSAQALAEGDLSQRVANSKLAELDMLAGYFNHMARQLQESMKNLESEVAEQRRMKEVLHHTSERLQLATRAAHIGIWEWNILSGELIWDDAMYRLYGIRKEDFSGAYDAWLQSLHPKDKDHAVAEILAAVKELREFNQEFRIVWPDGSTHIIKAAAWTIAGVDGKAASMIGINFDVTESRLAEEELRRHRDHLGELVAERTSELTVARDQADAANRAKSAFLSNMSHEIRTPMNAILGYTQLMQRLPDLSPMMSSHISVLDRSGAHLMALIDSVLEMSKIEAGRTVLQEGDFNFNAVLRDVESMLGGRAAEKGLSMKLEVDPRIPDVIHADRTKVQQVLVNIIGNAVKFTDRGGIEVQVALLQAHPWGVVVGIDVIDTGPGIAAPDLPKVFEMFEQTASGREKGGTGLGMPISRRYARMMGGDLTLESTPGSGTTVHFSFAAGLAEMDGKQARPAKTGGIVHITPDSPVPKILIVDDIASNRKLLRLMLEGVGLNSIRETADSALVCGLVSEWRPDLVLLDRRMPGMDGLQVTQAIRALPEGHAVRIIVVSASALDMERHDAVAHGADGFMSKPFRLHGILEEIRRLCPRLSFVYDEVEPDAGKSPEKLDHHADVAKIDSEVRAELIELIECGNVLHFERRIAEHVADSFPLLYARLHELSARFDYVNILEILKLEVK